MAKISIILAVYNGAEDVGRCIDSLRSQTYRDIEIICVDDGSTDNTLEILKQYAGEDERIRVLEQGENKKLLLAIKRGVKAATGEYIMFVDDDDWYEPNACERVAEIIADKQPDVIYYGTNLVETDGKTDNEIKANRISRLKSCDYEYCGENTLWLENIKYIYLWNKAVKSDVAKAAYDAMPDAEMTYCSDGYACMMIHYYAKSIVCIEDKLINYNYLAGISSHRAMSLDVFDYYLKCSKIAVDGLGSFLTANGTNEDNDRYLEWLKRRIVLLIQLWRDHISNEDALGGLECLFKYYGSEVIISALQNNYYKLNRSRNRYKKKYEQALKKIDSNNNKRGLLGILHSR